VRERFLEWEQRLSFFWVGVGLLGIKPHACEVSTGDGLFLKDFISVFFDVAPCFS
jgi:hypothetical protein